MRCDAMKLLRGRQKGVLLSTFPDYTSRYTIRSKMGLIHSRVSILSKKREEKKKEWQRDWHHQPMEEQLLICIWFQPHIPLSAELRVVLQAATCLSKIMWTSDLIILLLV
ncbi:unnamed protein product [Musa hybrid cultivar]